MNIAYTKIPGYNDLFLDYIYNFKKLSAFYDYDYSDKESIFRALMEKQENYPYKNNFTRDELAEILKVQNKFFNSSDAAFKNIELLKNENTFAVVTGQQAGLLSGNAYTIIKALNTFQLSSKYSAQFPEFNFVPVFWLECDDNDFLEINNINILNKNNELVNLKYFEKGIEKERYLEPVGSLLLDEEIENFKALLAENLTDTEFKETLFDYINRSYKPGINLAVAFARFMNYILGDLGIVFCNPHDKDIKRLLIPVFEKELVTSPHTCENVIEVSAVLEQEYEPQVKPKSLNLFYTHNGHRHLIEPRPENIFALRNTRQKFEKQELFDILYKNPENFSGNVVLRPVCQDYLLPSVAYVAGPSEVAYLGQLKGVYNHFNLKMPVIYPRTSVTFMESKISAFLNKFELYVDELYDEKKVTSKLMHKINEIQLDEVFGNYFDDINALIYSLSNDLEKIDKNLLNTFNSKNEKYFDSMNHVKGKFIEAQVRQNENSIKKLKSVILNVFPNEELQERVYNIVYFLNKYGIDFLSNILNKIDIDNFNHQYIEINTNDGVSS